MPENPLGRLCSIEFAPEAVEVNRERFAAAVARMYPMSELLAGKLPHPITQREHVFDFENGLRLCVAIELHPQTHEKVELPDGSKHDFSLATLHLVGWAQRFTKLDLYLASVRNPASELANRVMPLAFKAICSLPLPTVLSARIFVHRDEANGFAPPVVDIFLSPPADWPIFAGWRKLDDATVAERRVPGGPEMPSGAGPAGGPASPN